MMDNLAFENGEVASSGLFPQTDTKSAQAVPQTDHAAPEERPLSTIHGIGSRQGGQLDLQYMVDDVPPWYLCIFLGIQNYLTGVGGLMAIPLIIAPAMCYGEDNLVKAQVMSTVFFVSGIITVLQSTVGTRLPIFQGTTASFLGPTFAILNLPKWQCPQYNATWLGDWETDNNATYIGSAAYTESWQLRMREIQGAIMLAALFQVVAGLTGAVGVLLRFIGPIVVAPTLALIGISLFMVSANQCAGQWWIAILCFAGLPIGFCEANPMQMQMHDTSLLHRIFFMLTCVGLDGCSLHEYTIALIALFSQYLHNVEIPVFQLKRGTKGWHCVSAKFALFRLFPVILAMCLVWLLCYILTITNVLPNDPKLWGYQARTDTKADALRQAPWFRFPYPGQWGMPTISVAAVIGMLSGVIAGMLESLGDYYTCARMSGAPPPPTHAINRGVFIEGLGCVLAGAWGSGTATTSFSDNTGAIGITKVGSRRVIQVAGCILIIVGMLVKVGALFVTIPNPIIGGVFMVTFGMIAAVGISNLQFVDLNSTRNLFIIGFALFFGLSMPQWVARNPGCIQTGDLTADQIIEVLLSTSMFVGGAVAFFLDNTIPGTDEERGIALWRSSVTSGSTESDVTRCYDFPYVGAAMRKWRWCRYCPICPAFTFEPDCTCCRKRHKGDKDADTKETVTREPHSNVESTPDLHQRKHGAAKGEVNVNMDNTYL